MVTVATPSSDSKSKLNVVSQALVSKAPGIETENQFKELRFNLSYTLQTSLNIETTLELFFNNIQDFVSTCGISYNYDQCGLALSLGNAEQHTVSYKLASDDLDLGSIVFHRVKAFTETELAVLEMLIGVLFFPLRNSLLYREAILSSMRDSLTGIGNRHALDLSFSREIALASRYDQPLSILVVDIDHFKKINDSVGHYNGDLALKHICNTLQNTLRETDQVFRFGGEEFVALLQNTNVADARVIAERIRRNIESTPVQLDKQKINTTVSIGLSAFNGNETANELFDRADQALYFAKESGRNRVEHWTEEVAPEKKQAQA